MVIKCDFGDEFGIRAIMAFAYAKLTFNRPSLVYCGTHSGDNGGDNELRHVSCTGTS